MRKLNKAANIFLSPIANTIDVPNSTETKAVLNFIDAPCEKKVYKTGICKSQPNIEDMPINMVNAAKARDGLIVDFTDRFNNDLL